MVFDVKDSYTILVSVLFIGRARTNMKPRNWYFRTIQSHRVCEKSDGVERTFDGSVGLCLIEEKRSTSVLADTFLDRQRTRISTWREWIRSCIRRHERWMNHF
jgi:hypothetical protein